MIQRDLILASINCDSRGRNSYDSLPLKYKCVLLNLIKKNLDSIQQKKGDDFLMLVWETACRALAVADWDFKVKNKKTNESELNPFPVWKAILRKATAKAVQTQSGETRAESLLKQMEKVLV
jgi:hypothetical protein